ncbi:MAG: hypothetical protein ACOYMS_02765 [Terrimicrobiaceae bacterium]
MTISVNAATQKAVEAAAVQEDAAGERGKGSLDVFYGCIEDDSFRAPADLHFSSDARRVSGLTVENWS